MKSYASLSLLGLFVLFLSSCSVISSDMRKEADPPVPFKELLRNTERYTGKTVILGGYIIETLNREGETVITVLQTRLGISDSPVKKEESEGRFMILYDGFLDPEVYAKGRRLTVAGIVDSLVSRKVAEAEVTYLKIRSREIYLFAEEKPVYYYPVYYTHPYHHHRW